LTSHITRILKWMIASGPDVTETAPRENMSNTKTMNLMREFVASPTCLPWLSSCAMTTPPQRHQQSQLYQRDKRLSDTVVVVQQRQRFLVVFLWSCKWCSVIEFMGLGSKTSRQRNQRPPLNPSRGPFCHLFWNPVSQLDKQQTTNNNNNNNNNSNTEWVQKESRSSFRISRRTETGSSLKSSKRKRMTMDCAFSGWSSFALCLLMAMVSPDTVGSSQRARIH
jgi:hypothetical protein